MPEPEAEINELDPFDPNAEVSAQDVADGWVDALCQCGSPGTHVGKFCPERDKKPGG